MQPATHASAARDKPGQCRVRVLPERSTMGEFASGTTARHNAANSRRKENIMKVMLHVDKVAALKAGKDRHGDVIVEVPAASLTEAQRETLALFGNYSGNADFRLMGDVGGKFGCNSFDVTVPLIAEATPEIVPILLDAIAARAAEVKAQRAAAEAAALADREAEREAWAALPVDDRIRLNRDGKWEPTRRSDGFGDLVAWTEARTRCDELNAQLRARKEAEEAAAKARKEAGEAALAAWGTEHGSEWLQARIVEGFEWVKLAEREYAEAVLAQLDIGLEAADTPEGYERDRAGDRTTPTLAEIECLRSVREKLAGESASCELVWAKYNPESDEDDYGNRTEEIERCEIAIEITTPTDSIRTYYFLPTATVTVTN